MSNHEIDPVFNKRNPLKEFFAKIYLILTLDCEQSAKLTSDSFDRDLDWSEFLAAKLHRLICSKSRRLDRQLVQLHNAFVEIQQRQGAMLDMPEPVKNRIRERLKRNDSKDQNSRDSSD